MDCPTCGTRMVVFAIPEAHRAAAPGDDAAAICPTCLTLEAAESDDAVPEDAAFSRIIDGFPDGAVGATLALAVGLLVDSLTLHRATIVELFDAVAEVGVDPWLVLERLAAAGSVQPDADLHKLHHQLEQLSG